METTDSKREPERTSTSQGQDHILYNIDIPKFSIAPEFNTLCF